MDVLFDSARLPAPERAAALRSAYTMDGALQMSFTGDWSADRCVVGGDLGSGVRLLRSTGGPFQLLRTRQQVGASPTEILLLGVNRQGEWSMDAAGSSKDWPAGRLVGMDSTASFEVRRRTAGSTDLVMLSYADLGVSVDLVRAATRSLAGSPVHALVRSHLAGMVDAVPALPHERRLEAGRATVLLIRTLLLTAAGDTTGREALADSLEIRVRAYIEAHLSNADLSVEEVAALHHVSRRHLYDTWARAGHDRTPAQWILHRRLERARRQLADPGRRRTGVAVIARSCGFADASHFSRRFREAYGVPPTTWRRDLLERLVTRRDWSAATGWSA